MKIFTGYFLFMMLWVISCNQAPVKAQQHQQEYAVGYRAPEAPSNSAAYKVIGIKDGDTFELLINGRPQVVRLAHIDCPEKKQPFGNKAKLYAADLCFGKQVTLIHNKKYERNKRLIAEVILKDGRNVNKELVKKGLAWHFKKYSTDKDYATLEVKARQQKVGVWSDKTVVAPWEWRKR